MERRHQTKKAPSQGENNEQHTTISRVERFVVREAHKKKVSVNNRRYQRIMVEKTLVAPICVLLYYKCTFN